MAHLKPKQRRKFSVRQSIRRKSAGRVRLSVFRSSRHIYAQIIDDGKGITLACASTIDKDFKGKKTADTTAATEVGALIAQRAMKAGVKEVVFDRGEYRYHGRVKALADAARENGLSF